MIPYNFPNRFEIRETDEGYSFETESGNTYYVTFLKYPTITEFLHVEVYMMNIDRKDEFNHRNGGRNRVRDTILTIVGMFFNSHNDALITVCDIIDGKQESRKRLFSRWFRDFGESYLEKLDADCMIDNIRTYASIMFRKDTPNKSELKKEFSVLSEINFYNSEL